MVLIKFNEKVIKNKSRMRAARVLFLNIPHCDVLNRPVVKITYYLFQHLGMP